MSNAVFRFGEWQVERATNSLLSGGVRRQMEPRAMDVLVLLCERANTVVSAEQLLEQCWGSTLHGDNPVHKTITQLRRLLGDSSTAPTYIETIRKRGYRTIAAVTFEGSGSRAGGAAGWTKGSPFRGLQPFDVEHGAVFFGREDATRSLSLAASARVRSGRALLLVLGPSGSGKTSLVRAGLVPYLMGGGAEGFAIVSVAEIDLGEVADGQLLTDIGGALLDWQIEGAGLFEGHSAYSLGLEIGRDHAAVVAALAAKLAPVLPEGQRLLLFLDRFEAVFSLPDVAETDRRVVVDFVEMLATSARVLVIIACRNDFYPRIAEYPALLEGKSAGAHFDLAPPTHAEIAQMIRLPAHAASLSFAIDPASQERLDDVLCRSGAASPDCLPLLQYTLQELYRLRSAQDELTFEAFRGLGGVEGAIGRRAEEVIAALDPVQVETLPRLLSLIVTLSSTSDAVSSRHAPWSALRSGAERDLVTALVDARLFVSELVGAEAGFGVAHEALLRHWSRATEWIAVHRNSLLVRTRIAAISARWVAEGRPADLLLPRGIQLDEARGLLQSPAVALAPDEIALIGSSTDKVRRREHLRRAAVALVAGLALLAALLGIAAMRANGVAQQRRADAEGLMGFMLGDFADSLRRLGRLDLLDSVSAKALSYLAGSGAEGAAVAQLQRAKALHVIGEVRIARGDTQQATAAFEAARAVLLPLLSQAPARADLLKMLGVNSFWLGQIRLDRNDWAGAQQFFQQYRDVSDRWHSLEPDNVDGWIEQSYAHNSLGSLALRRGDPRAAAPEFLLSIELKTRAYARKPQDRALAADLADSLSWVADTKETLGELDSAMDLYGRELELVDALHAAAPGDSLWADRLAKAYQHRAALALARGQDRDALLDYERAAALIGRNLELEPGNRGWQRNGAFVQLERQRVLARHDPPARVLAALGAVVQTMAGLTRLDPKKSEWARLEALTHQRIGTVLIDNGRGQEALHHAVVAQHSLEQLLSRNSSDWRTRVTLANTLLLQARIRLAQRDEEGMRQACRGATGLLRSLATGSSDYHVLDPWVRAHACLGQDETASAQRLFLERIGYREIAFTNYVSNHERRKTP